MLSREAEHVGGFWKRRIVTPWFDRPALDWIVLMVACAGAYLSFRNVFCDWTASPMEATRRALYQSLMTVSGTLLGLTLTCISILSSAWSRPVSPAAALYLTRDVRLRVSRLFFAAVRGLAVAFGVAMVGLLLSSREGEVQIALAALTLGCVILVVSRLTRMLRALSLVLEASAPSDEVVSPLGQPIGDDEFGD